jgi:WD40 repeat protein
VTINETVYTSGDLSNIDPSQYAGYMVDLDTEEMRKIDIPTMPYGVEFTPDGTEFVVSPFTDNVIRVYDVETLEVLRQWHSTQAGISDIAISPDGRTLLTNSSILASEPVTIAWDVETGAYIRRYFGHDSLTLLYSVSFAPDGERFISTAFDSKILLWNFSRQSGLDWIRENRYIRELSCSERDIYRVEPPCDK